MNEETANRLFDHLLSISMGIAASVCYFGVMFNLLPCYFQWYFPLPYYYIPQIIFVVIFGVIIGVSVCLLSTVFWFGYFREDKELVEKLDQAKTALSGILAEWFVRKTIMQRHVDSLAESEKPVDGRKLREETVCILEEPFEVVMSAFGYLLDEIKGEEEP